MGVQDKVRERVERVRAAKSVLSGEVQVETPAQTHLRELRAQSQALKDEGIARIQDTLSSHTHVLVGVDVSAFGCETTLDTFTTIETSAQQYVQSLDLLDAAKGRVKEYEKQHPPQHAQVSGDRVQGTRRTENHTQEEGHKSGVELENERAKVYYAIRADRSAKGRLRSLKAQETNTLCLPTPDQVLSPEKLVEILLGKHQGTPSGEEIAEICNQYDITEATLNTILRSRPSFSVDNETKISGDRARRESEAIAGLQAKADAEQYADDVAYIKQREQLDDYSTLGKVRADRAEYIEYARAEVLKVLQEQVADLGRGILDAQILAEFQVTAVLPSAWNVNFMSLLPGGPNADIASRVQEAMERVDTAISSATQATDPQSSPQEPAQIQLLRSQLDLYQTYTATCKQWATSTRDLAEKSIALLNTLGTNAGEIPSYPEASPTLGSDVFHAPTQVGNGATPPDSENGVEDQQVDPGDEHLSIFGAGNGTHDEEPGVDSIQSESAGAGSNDGEQSSSEATPPMAVSTVLPQETLHDPTTMSDLSRFEAVTEPLISRSSPEGMYSPVANEFDAEGQKVHWGMNETGRAFIYSSEGQKDILYLDTPREDGVRGRRFPLGGSELTLTIEAHTQSDGVREVKILIMRYKTQQSTSASEQVSAELLALSGDLSEQPAPGEANVIVSMEEDKRRRWREGFTSALLEAHMPTADWMLDGLERKRQEQIAQGGDRYSFAIVEEATKIIEEREKQSREYWLVPGQRKRLTWRRGNDAVSIMTAGSSGSGEIVGELVINALGNPLLTLSESLERCSLDSLVKSDLQTRTLSSARRSVLVHVANIVYTSHTHQTVQEVVFDLILDGGNLTADEQGQMHKKDVKEPQRSPRVGPQAPPSTEQSVPDALRLDHIMYPGFDAFVIKALKAGGVNDLRAIVDLAYDRFVAIMHRAKVSTNISSWEFFDIQNDARKRMGMQAMDPGERDHPWVVVTERKIAGPGVEIPIVESRPVRIEAGHSPHHDIAILGGWGTDHTIYSNLRNGLAQDRSVVTIGHPRRGGRYTANQSEITQGYSRVEIDKSQHVLEFIRERTRNGAGKLDIFCHSEGAIYGLIAACEMPEAVGNIILFGPGGLQGTDHLPNLVARFVAKMVNERREAKHSRATMMNTDVHWSSPQQAQEAINQTSATSMQYVLRNVKRAIQEGKAVADSDIMPMVSYLIAQGIKICVMQGVHDAAIPMKAVQNTLGPETEQPIFFEGGAGIVSVDMAHDAPIQHPHALGGAVKYLFDRLATN